MSMELPTFKLSFRYHHSLPTSFVTIFLRFSAATYCFLIPKTIFSILTSTLQHGIIFVSHSFLYVKATSSFENIFGTNCLEPHVLQISSSHDVSFKYYQSVVRQPLSNTCIHTTTSDFVSIVVDIMQNGSPMLCIDLETMIVATFILLFPLSTHSGNLKDLSTHPTIHLYLLDRVC